MKASTAKIRDLAYSFPMVAWFGLIDYVTINELVHVADWRKSPVEYGAQFANAVFASILIVLFLIRRVPVARPQGWAARAAGIVGGGAPMTLLLLPKAPPSPALALFSSGAILAGTLASIAVVFWLGRSFSILPQARALVTTGPYRFVRHPLYVCEIFTLFGLMWQFKMPWSALVLTCAAAAQLPRIHFEEKILSEAFPSYRDYARKTACLIPGLY